MKNNLNRSNATSINSRSFKSILEQMKRLTSKGNIKVTNKHWNIYSRGVSANDINYNNNPIGA